MILPDLLQPRLKVIFCGTAAGKESADRKAYYAGPGNKFYKTLFKCGLTDRLLAPEEFKTLPKYGIGLTDVAKFVHGNDNQIKHTDYDPEAFIAKIEKYQPKWVCFNGKEAASRVTGIKTKQLTYGTLTHKIGLTKLYLAPSTSGSANRYWDESYWEKLKNLLG
jgi:TDG/mug DNA glycosylase family protein